MNAELAEDFLIESDYEVVDKNLNIFPKLGQLSGGCSGVVGNISSYYTYSQIFQSGVVHRLNY